MTKVIVEVSPLPLRAGGRAQKLPWLLALALTLAAVATADDAAPLTKEQCPDVSSCQDVSAANP